MSAGQFVVVVIAWIDIVDAQEGPVGGIGIAVFVAHPSAAGTAVGEDDGLGLILRHETMGAREVVVGLTVDLARLLGTSIPAIATVGSVEPDLEQVAVLCQQFLQLCMEIFHVVGGAVESLMAIPGREVDTHLQPVFPARCSKFAHDVAFAVLIGRVAHAVVRIFRRPQAEAVVVLGREDDALHACLLDGARPLLRIESRGVERLRIGVAIAPFAIAECVGTKMYEGVGLHLLPTDLAG